jgi:membrane protease YdiL (CAAX protease family)
VNIAKEFVVKRTSKKTSARTQSAPAQAAAPSAEPGEIRQHTFRYLGIILVLPFLAHFLGAYVIAVATAFVSPTAAAYLHANAWLATGFSYAAFLLFTLFYLRSSLEPMARYGWTWSTAKLGVAIGIGVASGILMYATDLAFPGTYTLPPATIIGVVAALIGVIVLPALFEELLFRGVIQSFYQRVTKGTIEIGEWQVPVAVFIASGFEVLFHLAFPVYFNFFGGGLGATVLGTVPQLVYVAIFGAIGGYLYSRTGSLVAPIAVHAVGNLTELSIIWIVAAL